MVLANEHEVYSAGQPLYHEFLPVAGDGTGAYFLLQKLITCDGPQCFPNSDIFVTELKTLAGRIQLLDESKKPIIAELGKSAFDSIVAPRPVGSTGSVSKSHILRTPN